MKFSLSTGTLYPYPLRTVFCWARQAGFDGVELVINPEAIARGGQAVRRLAQAEGIEILSAHPTVVPLPGWRERDGGMARTIGLAQEAGIGLVIMHTPRSASLEEGEGLVFRQRIEGWQDQLAGSGLRLAVENKGIRAEAQWHYALTPLDRLQAFAAQYDLGLVLDTAHAGTAGEDLNQARRLFGSRLVNVHLSDLGGHVPLASLPLVHRFFGEHRFPGMGDLALASLLEDLGGSGYAGLVTLEVNPWSVRAWWPPAVRRYLARANEWMKRTALGAAWESAPGSEAQRARY
ncbi:MAG: sugar phosphate isomerase/epimerase family protein [Anaerolineae bacterium]